MRNEMTSAKILAHSISPNGDQIVTFELEYPRIIHSEFMTHRMFSRNAASSRAIPFQKMLQQLGARPVRFGQANAGMQDKGVDLDAKVVIDPFYAESFMTPAEAWEHCQEIAVEHAEAFYNAGFHKQVTNRLLEPFQFIKVIVTATELENFFWLRKDGAADPTIDSLAKKMLEAYRASTPFELCFQDWHLPCVYRKYGESGIEYFLDSECTVELSVDQAKVVSAARCAAVSYRNVEYGLDKSWQVYDRLVTDDRIHGSALEHQAKPIECELTDIYKFKWPEGVSHVDKRGRLWSGNFRGWIQLRKLIPGENHEA